jgi:thioredoxin 1
LLVSLKSIERQKHFNMRRILSLVFLLSLSAVAFAADKPYDESVDAKLEVNLALATAAKNTPILLIFGANWCPDCLALDKAMNKNPSAELLRRDFKIVKVDVGHKDKNVELAASYGVYLTNGIPTVVILSPKNEILYATKEGELSHARNMSEDGIYQFFKSSVASAKKEK